MTLRSAVLQRRRIVGAVATRVIAALTLSLALSGCIFSERWVFARQELIQPFPVGRYIGEKFEDGSWKRDGEPGNFALKDGMYQVSSNKPDEPGFAVFRLSARFFILFFSRPSGDGYYLLAEPKDGMYLIYEPSCSDWKGTPALQEFPPDKTSDSGSICYYTDREKLIGALITYGDTAVPRMRWKYDGPVRPATSSPDTPAAAEPPTVMLSVCNKSNKTARLFLVHRHLYEKDKASLRNWWMIQPADCQSVAIPQGHFYIFAQSPDGAVWDARDRFVCVTDQAVDRIVFDGEQCVEGEQYRGFRRLFSENPTFTYNLNP